MKLNLRKNKLLFINTILLLISFIVFFIFLHIMNYDTHDGRYSPMTILRERLLYHNDAEYFIQNCFLTYIPTILLTLSLVYFIILLVLLGKKEVQIKYLFLLICQSIYLIAIGYNYILDLTWYKGDHYNVYLSSEMLLPIIVFSVYHLVCIVICYVKDKKKVHTLESL